MKTFLVAKRSLRALFYLIFLLTFSLFSHGQSLKQMLLMPGDLTEKHAEYESDCAKCHSDFDQSNQKKLCLDCHTAVADDLLNVSGYHGLDNTIQTSECRDCHTDHKDREFDIVGLDTDTFNHNKTNFYLTGQHRKVACSNCHDDNKQKEPFRLQQHNCQDCHQNQSPHAEDLADNCSSCHSSESWKDSLFDHSTTKFPLKDSHLNTACQDCHINEQYIDIETGCNSCHAADDAHQQRFGQQCDDCHSEKEWKQSSFDHNQDTDFELLFSHQKTSCESCHHNTPELETLPTDCIGCHSDNDVHSGSQGTDCAACHSSENWSDNQFDHDQETDFKLTGNHRDVTCNSCHSSGQDKEAASTACVDCHKLADPHDNSLGSHCEQCHNTSGWTQSLFSHELVRFPLIGTHKQLVCEECHIDTNYSKTESSCSACHQNDDSHKGSLGDDCSQCHTPNDWTLWLFNHNQQSDFMLEGSHQDLQCQLCHNDQQPLNKQCSSCHREDDVHRGSFGRQCQHCHNETSFSR
ncbi:MAG: hypothetical protein V7708_10755 [Oceanicoccus sp.]